MGMFVSGIITGFLVRPRSNTVYSGKSSFRSSKSHEVLLAEAIADVHPL